MNLCMWGGEGDVGFHVFIVRADWAILSPPRSLYSKQYAHILLSEWRSGGGGQKSCPPFHHGGKFHTIKRVAR